MKAKFLSPMIPEPKLKHKYSYTIYVELEVLGV